MEPQLIARQALMIHGHNCLEAMVDFALRILQMIIFMESRSILRSIGSEITIQPSRKFGKGEHLAHAVGAGEFPQNVGILARYLRRLSSSIRTTQIEC